MIEMKYTQFVGIDVSKKTLDCTLVKGNQVIARTCIKNTYASIQEYFEQLDIKNGFLVCLEATGVYSNHVVDYCQKYHIASWLVSPIHVKRSMGLVRGKNDLIDADRIALFAAKNYDQQRLIVPVRKPVKILKALVRSRDALVKVRTQLKQTISERTFEHQQLQQIKQEAIQKSLEAIAIDIKTIEQKIEALIEEDQNLSRLFDIACSVIGIGKVVAWEIIITTNEFTIITDPKKFACHAGVAPFPNTSGTSLRGKNRVSAMANKKLKKLLHLAAVSSIRYHNDLREYYLRKVAEGKHKMSVLNAVRNKIINRLFACIKQNRKYQVNLHLS